MPTKRKLSKVQIADKFCNELKKFGIAHPYTLDLVRKYLAKWNPAIDSTAAIPAEWEHWKTSTVEWTPKGYAHLVILSSKTGWFRVFIAGNEIYSDIIQQCWQDGLAKMKQSQINEIIEAPSLFNLDDYTKGKGDGTTIYTHEDG